MIAGAFQKYISTTSRYKRFRPWPGDMDNSESPSYSVSGVGAWNRKAHALPRSWHQDRTVWRGMELGIAVNQSRVKFHLVSLIVRRIGFEKQIEQTWRSSIVLLGVNFNKFEKVCEKWKSIKVMAKHEMKAYVISFSVVNILCLFVACAAIR